MTIYRRVRRKVRAAIPPILFLSLVGYFLWNATQGDHGLHSYRERLKLLGEANASETAAKEELAAWQLRVAGLRDKGLDPDMLDERARAMLNLAEPGDIIIPMDRRQP
ncbi:MAG: septum formation initiator family protein [Gluconacetobacter diazotrophicus]|nr:septum formation initiator family protein [Gluconacetobacter diazotrophicus]